jgi:6-phosphogluconolactonase
VEKGILGEASIIAHTGHGPNEGRQSGPHVHSSQLEGAGGRLWVVDLGIDRAVFYNTADMSEAGSFAAEGGSGPRHMVFSGDLPFAWIVCELSSEVYAFEVGSGKRIGIYSTLPKGFAGKSSCAAIKLSPDGRRLYASNRGHDSIACYDINPETGALSLFSISPTGGRTPRDFAISPDGAFLYAANQDSDNIRVFKLEKGVPVETGLELNIPAPVCVLFT